MMCLTNNYKNLNVIYLKIFLLFLSFSLFFTGCQTQYKYLEDPPLIPERVPANPVRLALVLGGGGARGMAHVGVLEEFERAGIPIDIIVGCSAGSIVGALYADNPNARYVKKALEPLRKWDILDISVIYARYGFVQGRSLRRFLRNTLRSQYFSQLKIPLYIVATDLYAGELVCIGTGPIIPAVHASAAVPFVFAPVSLYGRVLVDGGVVDPIPVSTAKKFGADLVIAVDLSELLPKTCPTNLFEVASRSAEIKFLLQSESCVQGADIVIRPELGDLGLFDDKCNKLSYDAGRKAAREAIPQILDALLKHGYINLSNQ
jgi:NTE family protein